MPINRSGVDHAQKRTQAVFGVDQKANKQIISFLKEVYECGLVDGLQMDNPDTYYEGFWRMPKRRLDNISRIAKHFAEIRGNVQNSDFAEYYHKPQPYIPLESAL